MPQGTKLQLFTVHKMINRILKAKTHKCCDLSLGKFQLNTCQKKKKKKELFSEAIALDANIFSCSVS